MAQGEAPVQDHDSNSWPQTGRNKALRAIRKGLAVHIAGDQHLGSTIQYGIDDWNDAGFPPSRGATKSPEAPAIQGSTATASATV